MFKVTLIEILHYTDHQKRHKNDTKRYHSGAAVFMLNSYHIWYINFSLFNKVQTGPLFFPHISLKLGTELDMISHEFSP